MKQYLSKELLCSVRSFNDLVKVANRLSASIKSCASSNAKIARMISKSSDDDDDTFRVGKGKDARSYLEDSDLPTHRAKDLKHSSNNIKDLLSHIDMLKSTLLMAEYYSNLHTYKNFVDSLKDLIDEAEEGIDKARANLRAIANDGTPREVKTFSDKVKEAFAKVVPRDYYEGNPQAFRFVTTKPSKEGESYVYQLIITTRNFRSLVGINEDNSHVYPYLSVVASTVLEPKEDESGNTRYAATHYIQVLADKLEPGHFELGILVKNDVQSKLGKLISNYAHNILVQDNREMIPESGKHSTRLHTLIKLPGVKRVDILEDKVIVNCLSKITDPQVEEIHKNIFLIVRAFWPKATPVISNMETDESGQKSFYFIITKGLKAKPNITRQDLLDFQEALGIDKKYIPQLKAMMLD